MPIPECPWRFGEKYLATDFIMANNHAIIRQANILFEGTWPDEFVENVAKWIRDDFYYPFDSNGNPSASGQLLRHQKGLRNYHFKNCVYYAWSLPNEVLDLCKCGICIDTANLVGSIFRVEQVRAWVTLGDVRSAKDNVLLGRHAWIEVPYKDGLYVMETTVHTPGTNNLIEFSQVYNKDSSWAQSNNLYYIVQAKYNESEFIGQGPLGAEMIELMGLPANRVLLFGLEATRKQKPNHLYKEWRKEEHRKESLLKEAYGR